MNRIFPETVNGLKSYITMRVHMVIGIVDLRNEVDLGNKYLCKYFVFCFVNYLLTVNISYDFTIEFHQFVLFCSVNYSWILHNVFQFIFRNIFQNISQIMIWNSFKKFTISCNVARNYPTQVDICLFLHHCLTVSLGLCSEQPLCGASWQHFCPCQLWPVDHSDSLAPLWSQCTAASGHGRAQVHFNVWQLF